MAQQKRRGPGRPSHRASHLEPLLSRPAAYQTPEGAWDLALIMAAFHVSRPTARDLAELATRRQHDDAQG
jgi:hypothetical protein